MKRKYIYAALLYAFTVAVTPAVAGQPQQEKIGRGVVAVKTDEGVFVSWRYLGTDSPSAGFNLYRDGEKLNDEPHDIDQLRRQGGDERVGVCRETGRLRQGDRQFGRDGRMGQVLPKDKVATSSLGRYPALLGNQRRRQGRLSQRATLLIFTKQL